jgi:hypothetical protein
MQVPTRHRRGWMMRVGAAGCGTSLLSAIASQ